MMTNSPRLCRGHAWVLSVSHYAIWRLRVLGRLTEPADPVFTGVVVADVTFHCESHKGSREWVRHRRDPTRHPKPPRSR